jgi:hypothetical protein
VTGDCGPSAGPSWCPYSAECSAASGSCADSRRLRTGPGGWVHCQPRELKLCAGVSPVKSVGGAAPLGLYVGCKQQGQVLSHTAVAE